MGGFKDWIHKAEFPVIKTNQGKYHLFSLFDGYRCPRFNQWLEEEKWQNGGLKGSQWREKREDGGRCQKLNANQCPYAQRQKPERVFEVTGKPKGLEVTQLPSVRLSPAEELQTPAGTGSLPDTVPKQVRQWLLVELTIRLKHASYPTRAELPHGTATAGSHARGSPVAFSKENLPNPRKLKCTMWMWIQTQTSLNPSPQAVTENAECHRTLRAPRRRRQRTLAVRPMDS